MAKPTWVTSAGSLGTFEEKTTQNISLSTTGENVKLSLISGTLPPGMRFENNAIVGTPFDVAKNRANSNLSTFPIRADSDRILLRLDLTWSHLGFVFPFRCVDRGRLIFR